MSSLRLDAETESHGLREQCLETCLFVQYSSLADNAPSECEVQRAGRRERESRVFRAFRNTLSVLNRVITTSLYPLVRPLLVRHRSVTLLPHPRRIVESNIHLGGRTGQRRLLLHPSPLISLCVFSRNPSDTLRYNYLENNDMVLDSVMAKHRKYGTSLLQQADSDQDLKSPSKEGQTRGRADERYEQSGRKRRSQSLVSLPNLFSLYNRLSLSECPRESIGQFSR